MSILGDSEEIRAACNFSLFSDVAFTTANLKLLVATMSLMILTSVVVSAIAPRRGMNFLHSLEVKMLLEIWGWERFTFFTDREKGKVCSQPLLYFVSI